MTQQQGDTLIQLHQAALQYAQDTLVASQVSAGHIMALRDMGIFICVSLCMGFLVIWNVLAHRN